MPYLYFLHKSPIISGSIAENDLQLKASCGSVPLCNTLKLTTPYVLYL